MHRSDGALDPQCGVRIYCLSPFAEPAQGYLPGVARVLDCPTELILVDSDRGDVDERAERRRDGEAALATDVVGVECAVVEHYVRVTRSEARWDSEVHAGGIELTEVVHAEGSLVRHDRTSLAPEIPADEIVMRANRPVGHSEDASVDPQPVAVVDVELLLRVGVADVERLSRGEVSGLTRRDGRETTAEITRVGNHAKYYTAE